MVNLPACRRTRTRAAAAVLLLLALAPGPGANDVTLDVHAPPRLSSAAGRLQTTDYSTLRKTLESAGLQFPARISATLVATDDARVARIPQWVVGLASGTEHVMIFPERIGPYPYDSLESVMRHEIVHLALNDRAGGRPLPRWFHEGVAVTLESGWSTRDDLRLLLAALDPPSMADIARLFASDAYPDTTQAYLLSAALVDEIRTSHGSAAIGGIARQFSSGLSFDAAFAAATGESVEAAAERAWRGHRRLSRWVPVLTSPSAAWTLIMGLAGVAFLVRLRRVRELRRRWDEEEEDEELEPWITDAERDKHE
jgi:hypothetical protein